MKLNPAIEKALKQISFVERYKSLSAEFDEIRTPLNDRLRYIDGEIIIEIVESLGYTVEFNSKDKYFLTKEDQINGKYKTLVKFDLNGGMVEFIWEVWLKDKVILGSPWGTYSVRMGMNEGRIKKPIFGTYEDLGEIFRIGFELYEDFKKALIEQ